MKLFISPHNDDETLFGAFTILRERPLVLIVYDSWVQFRRGDPVTALERRNESLAAMNILGAEVQFCGLSDEVLSIPECETALRPYLKAQRVWAPAFERNGNPHHNLVASVAESLFPNSQRYMTYTSAGKSSGSSGSDRGWLDFKEAASPGLLRVAEPTGRHPGLLPQRPTRVLSGPAKVAQTSVWPGHVRRMLAP